MDLLSIGLKIGRASKMMDLGTTTYLNTVESLKTSPKTLIFLTPFMVLLKE